MTTTILTDQLKLTTLKHLASGKGLDVVATIVGLPRETVLDIGSKHGYPDKDKLAWAADVVETKLRDDATNLPTRAPEPGVRRTPPAAGAATPSPAAPAPDGLTKPDEIRVLLNTAKAHPSKRIQNAADRVFDDLAKLRTLIADDEEKHAARRKADAEKAAARAEVERLEQQLRDAKAKLRGKSVPKGMEVFDRAAAKQGEHGCDRDECDRTFGTVQALRLHQRRAHEGFNPNAAQAAS